MNRDLLSQALDALTVLLDEWTPAREAQLKGTDVITALREALAAPMPEPSDMVMVPREPTPDMARAGRKAVAAVADKMEAAKQLAVHVIDFWQQVGHTPANEIYRAMIAAAPPAAPAPVVREPLTQDQIISLAENYEERYHRWVFICVDELEQFARAIEKAHGIGGGGNG